ncbi:MAG: MBL fold metallo-hydrolase [Leptonema sp. (in: bacteria)]
MKDCIIIGSGNAFNTDARGHCSFLLDSIFLIDCGPTILLKRESLNIDFSKIKVVLITHFHGDHFAGLPFLVLYFEYILKRKEILYILGPKHIKNQYWALMNLIYPNININFTIEFVEIQNTYTFQNYQITPYPITHKEESIGYKIFDGNHSFAFSGDTILDENVYPLYDNIDVGIIELSLKENANHTSHVSLEELILNRSKIKAKKLYFNHLYDELAEEVRKINQLNPEFGTPLYDGMRICFE